MQSLNYKKIFGEVKWLLLIQLFCLIALVNSCGNEEKEKRQRELNELQEYVRVHRDSVDLYTERNWDELNEEYNAKQAELEKNLDKFDEEGKAAYNKTKTDWEGFKSDYTRKAEANSGVEQMDRLRKTLAIDNVRPDYTDLMANDLVKQYTYFVNTVDTKRDDYTREEWTVINVNYKALNGRKRELEKDIAAGDMNKIVKQQLRYTGIKAANRPFAENE